MLISSNKLRKTLLDAQQLFDPKKKNPNFNQMVIIGHSMGGLLTKSMVQTTNNKLVDMIFETPIDEMKIQKEDKKMLNDALIFESLPFVKRVIFMSTPHRGSEMTHWATMRIAVNFINLPMQFVKKMGDVAQNVKMKEGVLKGSNKSLKDLQGVDGLDPQNVVMRYLAEQPLNAKYHSIIGNANKNHREQ